MVTILSRRQRARLPHPIGQLCLIPLINMKIPRPRILGIDWRDRVKRRASKEGEFEVLGEAVDAKEPRLAAYAVER